MCRCWRCRLRAIEVVCLVRATQASTQRLLEHVLQRDLNFRDGIAVQYAGESCQSSTIHRKNLIAQGITALAPELHRNTKRVDMPARRHRHDNPPCRCGCSKNPGTPLRRSGFPQWCAYRCWFYLQSRRNARPRPALAFFGVTVTNSTPCRRRCQAFAGSPSGHRHSGACAEHRSPTNASRAQRQQGSAPPCCCRVSQHAELAAQPRFPTTSAMPRWWKSPIAGTNVWLDPSVQDRREN